MKISKRPFLLIEVLLALFLISLCIAPLIRWPIDHYRSELQKLEELELQRLADWSFSEIKEMLLKNELSWDSLPTKGEAGPYLNLPDASIALPGSKPKKVKRKFYLTGRGQKAKNGETQEKTTESRQLGIFIELEEKTYEFRLPVQKIFDK